LRGGAAGGGENERDGEGCDAREMAGADHGGESPSQRISCEVVCSIWSAALITLEFIS
jgi:hypothetical protein